MRIDKLRQNTETIFWWKILDSNINNDFNWRKSFIQTLLQIKHTPHMAPAQPYNTGVQITDYDGATPWKSP